MVTLSALAVLALHLAVVGAPTMVNGHAPPPPQLQLLTTTTTTARSVPPTAIITIAIIAFFVLVLFCVLVNMWRRSSADADASGGGGCQGSVRRRRRRGLDPAALAALPVVPYAEIRKHKSGGGGGGLECAVCLTAFDDGDELRLLPQCSHAFHPECIDPWLEGHVTCPLCRANLEKPASSPLPSPEKEPPQTPEAAVVAVRVEAENDDEERKEEAAELEKLRCARRAARMPRSRSIVSATSAAETGDHERFTVRLPPHVREEVLRSRRLRHATSLVITLGGGGASSDCPGSSTACSAGGERCVRRRWASFLSRTASWSWAQGGGESSAGKKGVGPEAGSTTRRPPCGHVLCSLAARWPARCKAKNSA